MQKARAPHQNRLVDASDPRAPRRAICDNCGAAVSLRKGIYRRPHYAHNAGEGNADCVDFHGGDGGFSHHAISQWFRKPVLEAPPSRRAGGLFISYDSSGCPALYVQLPEPTVELDRRAQVVIEAIDGEYKLSPCEASGAKLIRVKICERPLIVRAAGDGAKQYLQELNGPSFWLNSQRNLFRWSAGAGKLMTPATVLSWGNKYWFLASASLPTPESIENSPLVLRVIQVEIGWTLFEIQLPDSEADIPLKLDQVHAWLGSSISAPRPSLSLSTDAIHHIDDFGRFVISDKCEQFEVIRTDDYVVDAIAEDSSPLEVFEKNENVVEVRATSNGVIHLFIDEMRALDVVRQHCPLFAPSGIGFHWKNRIREIFEGDHVFREWNESSDEMSPKLYVENEALLTIVRVNGERISSLEEASSLKFDKAEPLSIEAAAFGSFHWVPQEKVETKTATGALENLEAYARFLISLAETTGTRRLPMEFSTLGVLGDSLARTLFAARWPNELQPNLRYFSNLFREMGGD